MKSQFIDSKGKLRGINYSKISIITEPKEPIIGLNVGNVIYGELNDALEFIKENNYKILSQDGDEYIRGLYILLNKEEVFIPLKKSEPLENVKFEVFKQDPISYEKSKLEEYREAKKIAENLKMYAIYLFKEKGDLDFVIKPKHKYTYSKVYSMNDGFIENGKIIVKTEEMKNRLIKFIETKLLNDSKFTNISLKENDQYYLFNSFDKGEWFIFNNIDDIKRWRTETSRIENINKIEYYPNNTRYEPYFLRNIKFNNGNLIMVQNTDDLIKAYKICKEWNKNRVNIGFSDLTLTDLSDSDIDKELDNYVVYNDNGDEVMSSNKKEIEIIEYYNGGYGAILHFDKK